MVIPKRNITNRGVASNSSAPRNPLKENQSISPICQDKPVDLELDSGYIYNMADRNREKDSMIHVRFTEEERRKLKAICAMKGISMQEYLRELVLNALKRSGKDRN